VARRDQFHQRLLASAEVDSNRASALGKGAGSTDPVIRLELRPWISQTNLDELRQRTISLHAQRNSPLTGRPAAFRTRRLSRFCDFMEEHPEIDYGTPGPLVHFLERFYKKGYEEQLVLSIRRKPTCHTIWMLNRLINGARAAYGRLQSQSFFGTMSISITPERPGSERPCRWLRNGG